MCLGCNRMTFLFRSGTLSDKFAIIFRATRTHATNLAKYATIYKLTMVALKHIGNDPGKEGPFDTFIAGLLGGYLVFGRRSKRGNISSVSKQIVIFGKNSYRAIPRLRLTLCPVFARVILSLALLSIQPETGIVRNSQLRKRISHNAWPAFAALSWGSVMWLFRWYPDTVQSGLRSSMDYIYVQSDHWDSLGTFMIHNK